MFVDKDDKKWGKKAIVSFQLACQYFSICLFFILMIVASYLGTLSFFSTMHCYFDHIVVIKGGPFFTKAHHLCYCIACAVLGVIPLLWWMM